MAVSSALIADHRTSPLASDLYVPTSWTDETDRRALAIVPERVIFRETRKVALAQVRAILKTGFTITGVVVDAEYGHKAAFREGLERLGLAYGVATREGLGSRWSTWMAGRSFLRIWRPPADAWQTVTWGADSAPPIVDRFYALRVRPVEGRTYRGWTHRVVLTAVVFTFLQIERGRRGDDTPNVARGARLGPRDLRSALGHSQLATTRHARQLPPPRSALEVTKQ